jgi:hypothetical protein
MDVAKLFDELLVIPDVEIVVAFLPKVLRGVVKGHGFSRAVGTPINAGL